VSCRLYECLQELERGNGIRECRLAPHNGQNRVSAIPCCDDNSRASFQYDGEHPLYSMYQLKKTGVRCEILEADDRRPVAIQ
jgi:hypothetical protein